MTLFAAIVVGMTITACKYEPVYNDIPEKKNDGKMVAELHYGHVHYVITFKEEKKEGSTM